MSPGLLVFSSPLGSGKIGLDLRDDLGHDRADDLRHVVLDPDHAVPATEHRVELREKLTLPEIVGTFLNFSMIFAEHDALRRPVGAPDRGDDDRRSPTGR